MMLKKYIKDFRTRLALVVSAALLVFLFVFAFLGYIYNYNNLRDTAGESHKEIARLMADNVAGLMDREMELLKSAASSGEAIYEGARASNLRYSSDEKAAERYLMDMDKKWIEAPDDHPLIKEYLENKVSARLKNILSPESKIVSLLVVDKFGGIVGSTARTSDFYQGNKDWWKDSYNNGSGKTCIGNIVYDERTKTWCVPFVAPIKDRSGELVGLCRSLVDISLFFKPLEDFKLGETGLADMVDDKGYLVYQRGVKPFTNKFCGYEELRKVVEAKRSWLIMDGIYSRTSKVFVSFSEITYRLLDESGIKWRVFVTEDLKEVFAPVARLLFHIIITGIVLISLSAIAIFLMAGAFIKPISKMKDGIDRIARGELDYRIEAGDEIELQRLADSINSMVTTVKSSVAPVANLDKEISQRKRFEERLNRLSSGFAAILSALVSPIMNLRDGFKVFLDEMPKTLNEKQKKAINTARIGIDAISAGMVKLLDVAKIESGKVTLNKKAVDVRALLRNAIFEFEPKIRDKGLDFKLDVPKDTINVLVDPEELKKVLNNLMENAVKFTDRGYVGIFVKELKDDVECSIVDTGVGIKPESLPKIFEKFNPGIGLAIAKEIIEMHNGKIFAESEFGKGTKLTFRLPKYNPAGHAYVQSPR